ncbi:YecA family protein [Pantoea sp. 1.19]|uniref:YecA/YgfB family protein n=1 Tax=Pantoea sp. 1.19 TaxID=1925589 RepID=UPI000948FE16|nr:YecA family protein [Pantoea sp. 1.19]
MNQGPLTENELNWLDDTLEKYRSEASIQDVAELDGLLTAVLSGPTMVEPSRWLVALWGGEKHIPRWHSEREMSRFMDLAFQHMNDIADRLADYPEQFEPLFGTRTMEGTEFTVVEEWCFGYLRGVGLSDWSSLPDALQPALEAIRLHGSEANFPRVEALSPEAFADSMEAIRPAALALHDYWLTLPPSGNEAPQTPAVADAKPGRNDPCLCGSGKKYKQCCLH